LSKRRFVVSVREISPLDYADASGGGNATFPHSIDHLVRRILFCGDLRRGREFCPFAALVVASVRVLIMN
jgi:hypothetical protein